MKKITDLKNVTVREAINEYDEQEFHIEGFFKNNEQYVIAVFDSTCEVIADEVSTMINNRIKQ